MEKTAGLAPFLQKTKYCDFENPKIRELFLSLTKNLVTDREKAVALFYWVRDNILYRVGMWNRLASETIAEGEGVCTSKANLLIALMRASGIAAGYGVMRVKGQEYFGEIVPPFLKKKISEESVHVYVCVYLDGRWIKCDPSDDKQFSEKTSYINPQSKLVEWDGEHDATLNLDDLHILKDEWPIADIDALIDKKPQTATGPIITMGNLYIKFLRANDQKIISANQLEELFIIWLKKNHFLSYFEFQLASRWLNLLAKVGLARY